MNISFSPINYINNLNKTNNKPANYKYISLAPLQADTVQFSGKIRLNGLSDATRKGVELGKEVYQRLEKEW